MNVNSSGSDFMCRGPGDTWKRTLGVINGPVMVSLAVFSIAANCCSIAALRRHRTWRQVRIYTIFLAFWDILIDIGSLSMIGVPNIMYIFTGWTVHNASYVSLAIMAVGYCLCNCALVGAIWSTMAFAVDRYCALCHPMWHRRWSLAHRRGIVVAIAIGVVLVNIPRLIAIQITSIPNGNYALDDGNFRNPEILMLRAVISVLFISGIPTLILFGLGVRITLKLRKHGDVIKHSIRVAQRHKSVSYGTALPSGSRTGRQSNLRSNIISLCIVINSVVFHSIPVFVDVHEALIKLRLVEPFRICVDTINILIDIGNFLVVLNTICCIVVYLCDSRFRFVFVNVLLCRREQVLHRNWNTEDGETVRLVERKKPILTLEQ